jgi:hypothetical protein
VATNAAEDPAITQTLAAFSGEGSWARSPDAASPTGFSWTFTAEQSNWQWLGELSMIGVKDVVSNSHHGEKMHVLLYAGTTLSYGISLRVFAHNGSSWATLNDLPLIQPGPMAWHEGTFTMPTDPNIKVRLNSYYLIGNTGTITIGAVMLLTDTDYQALQARGISYFNGDSYVRGVV